MWVVAARDCKINCFYNVESDGSILVLMYSNEDIEYPVGGAGMGVVTGTCPIGGALISPDPTDPSKCIFKFSLEINLNGWVPSMVTQRVINYQSYGLIELKKYIEEWLQLHGERHKNEPIID